MKMNVIMNRIIIFLQAFILIPVAVLQYLSDKKMGVMRYLVFKKNMLSRDIFTPDLMTFYKAALVLGVIVSLILLMYILVRKVDKSMRNSLFEIALLNLMGIAYVFSGKFQELLTYHFFLIAIFFILVMEYIKGIVNLLGNNNKL